MSLSIALHVVGHLRILHEATVTVSAVLNTSTLK